MTPHEEALLRRTGGKRREELERAIQVLDRVRAAHPGVADLGQLPPGVRDEAMGALRVVRLAGGAGRLGIGELFAAIVSVVAVAVMIAAPVRVFTTGPGGEGEAAVTIARSFCGIAPLSREEVRGVASASSNSWIDESTSHDANGRTSKTRTRMSDLHLSDAGGRELFVYRDSHLVGASLAAVAEDVTRVVSGERDVHVRWNLSWVPHLVASLFLLIGAPHAIASVGLFLRERGLLPQTLYAILFRWGPTLAILALVVVSWLLAFMGGSPPGWLVVLLGLS